MSSITDEIHANQPSESRSKDVQVSEPSEGEKKSIPAELVLSGNTSMTEEINHSCKGDSNEDKLENLSYVILPSDNDSNKNMNNEDVTALADVGDDQETDRLTSSQRSNATSTSTASTSESSVREKLKKSASFLMKSKIVSNHEQTTNASDLPSTLANAFSSLSSFTSNFSLSSPLSLNGLQNNSHHNAINDNQVNLTIETATNSTKSNQIVETRSEVYSRKTALERKNLLNLTKLIVRDLITSSLVSGRAIESESQCAIHLNNYFALIDRVLKHGLKQNILSNPQANLWAVIDNISKYLKESTLMSESIRSLAHTKTPDGKIKAWMRLAMMQKRLPEYFNEMSARRDVLLKDIYLDHAFMLNDESFVFSGLIIGVNVVDCNFFVKDDNFDLMDDIIDLSPYLKSSNSLDEEIDDSGIENQLSDGQKKEQVKCMAKILDQNNYLEEWNKHLQSIISNLQNKIKTQEEQISRLEMEIKVTEARITKLQEKSGDSSSATRTTSNDSQPIKTIMSSAGLSFPDAFKNMISINRPATGISRGNTHSSKTNNSISATSVTVHSVEEKLESSTGCCTDLASEATEKLTISTNCEPCATNTGAPDQPDVTFMASEIESYKSKITEQELELGSLRERISILETSYRGSLDKIRVLERDLDVQTSMRSDKETTIEIYERDNREKQQQVDSLRASLVDAKKLNSDLSERLANTNAKLKERLNIVNQLQASLDKWKLENKTLASRLQDKQTVQASLAKELERAMQQIKDLKEYNEKINNELHKERECGHSSSVTVEEQNVRISELTEKYRSIESELNQLRTYRAHYEALKKRCQDYEQSLEEIGAQLRESRLEVENLKENSSVYLDSQWMDSKQVKQCALCQQSFSVTRRKHHCRLCGNVFCQTCSDNKMELASSAKPARVCDTCHAFLLAKFVKSASSSTVSPNLVPT